MCINMHENSPQQIHNLLLFKLHLPKTSDQLLLRFYYKKEKNRHCSEEGDVDPCDLLFLQKTQWQPIMAAEA